MDNAAFEFTRKRLMPGFDGRTCKISPAIATDGETTLVSYGDLLLTGSDVFTGSYIVKSTDGGETFSAPVKQTGLPDKYENGLRFSHSASVYYNRTHKRWFGLGVTVPYEHDRHPVLIDGVAPNKCFFCGVDTETCQFTDPRPIDIPFEYVCGYNFGQTVELEDGDMLIPFNFTTKENTRMMAVVIRYTFSGDSLRAVKVGTPIIANEYGRGVCEPSLARLNGRYYLALRTDEVGLFAESEDGYSFGTPKPYVWDDGSVLENYNTQQHWMISKNALYLAYTRRGAHNDHVFRHRAPIFMARFDEKRGCLIRGGEVILVPELGARLGNFCAIAPNENEAWLITAEWMQSWGGKLGVCEKYGSDNSFWLAKVFWKYGG